VEREPPAQTNETLTNTMEWLLEFCQASPIALWGLFALLILCGFGLPLPEDIVLITAGLVTAANGDSWIGASIIMYAGVLAGDSLIFGIGYRFGPDLLAKTWIQRWLTPARQDRISEMFAKHGAVAFFLARFMPGLRAPVFCMAGAMGARYLKFLLFDGLAALISVPVFVWLGNFLWRTFGDDLEQLRGAMSRAHFYTTLFAVGLVIAIGVTAWVNRHRWRTPIEK